VFLTEWLLMVVHAALLDVIHESELLAGLSQHQPTNWCPKGKDLREKRAAASRGPDSEPPSRVRLRSFLCTPPRRASVLPVRSAMCSAEG